MAALGQNIEPEKIIKENLLKYGSVQWTERINRDSAVAYQSKVTGLQFSKGDLKITVNHVIHFKSVGGLAYVDYDAELTVPTCGLSAVAFQKKTILLTPDNSIVVVTTLKKIYSSRNNEAEYEDYAKYTSNTEVPFSASGDKKLVNQLMKAFASLK